MYWQMSDPIHESGTATRFWLPKGAVPEAALRRQPQAAPQDDARSVHPLVAVTEAILRMMARFPGLTDKVASAIPFLPGQSRHDHFNTLMEAISCQGRFHPGLGLAISETLQLFRTESR